MQKLSMRKFIIIILACFIVTAVFAEKSPHGETLKINCAVCHTTDNWNKIRTGEFNHNKTNFPLVGQHQTVNCRKCHTSLEFSKAKTDCNACHTDIHQGTVGQDCARCHTPNSWIVNNVKQIHQQQGFLLIGAHASADCARCHTSSSQLRFDNIRTDCFSCHKNKYDETTGGRIDHKALGFDIDCGRCHNMTGLDWSSNGRGFEHGFFPLTGGHNIACDVCHFENDYKTKLSSDCYSCHSGTYDATNNPPHASAGFSTDCKTCHSINAWTPATFDHEKYFPIKSGKHQGINCIECHTNSANYAIFACTNCHEHSKSRMDSKHDEVGGYVYNSTNCYSCHPKGKAD